MNEPSPASGPAKASSFMDPRTGKVDYWKWLDAGAARIGQGGTVLEDDSPEFMAQNGIMNRPAAMIAAGAPENAAPPRDSFVQDGPPGWKDNQAKVTNFAADGGADAKATPEGAQAGGGDGANNGGQEGSGQTPGGDTTPPQPDYTSLPISPEGWKDTPWGQGVKWDKNLPTREQAPAQDPNAYDYPKVGEPPDTPEGQRIRALIEKHAKLYNVPVQLMYNKAHVETGGTWNPNAYNKSGASGLFQLMPDTARRLKIQNPFDLESNINGATQLMSNLLRQTKGDPFLAEIGYNSSPQNIYSGGSLPYETFFHLQKVFPGQHQDYLWDRVPQKVLSNPFLFWGAMGMK